MGIPTINMKGLHNLFIARLLVKQNYESQHKGRAVLSLAGERLPVYLPFW